MGLKYLKTLCFLLYLGMFGVGSAYSALGPVEEQGREIASDPEIRVLIARNAVRGRSPAYVPSETRVIDEKVELDPALTVRVISAQIKFPE